MENMVTEHLFSDVYKGKTVLVTGHTGFKGSWLAFWLTLMGARVVGYSLEAPTSPAHIRMLGLDIVSIVGDIRDQSHLNSVFAKYKPDIVFHLAAQPLVLQSYRDPVETYETNVLGTLKVLEASRQNQVKAIVNITSDKCYENKEWIWGYREEDPLGGFDPYSSSKGCAEILTRSYRNSYFNLSEYGRSHATLLASCRAGNVVGGGDWAQDRLIPDIIRAIEANRPLAIRSPHAVRPWQHVLEPLSGYLLVGQKLLEGKTDCATACNFGPNDAEALSVKEVIKYIKKFWDDFEYTTTESSQHEAMLLRLDCTQARVKLNWQPVWGSSQTFEYTTKWYKTYYESGHIATAENLLRYISDAKKKGLPWVK